MKRITLLMVFLTLSSSLFAFETLLVNQSYLRANVNQYADYLNTPDEDLSILQISKPNIARQFTPVHGDILKYNQLKSTTWLTFAVNNPTGKPVRMFLKIDAPFVRSVELFSNIRSQRGYQRMVTGVATPYSKRPYQLSRFVLPVEIGTGYQQLYIKVVPLEATNMKIRLLDENTLLKEGRLEVQFNSLIFIMLLTGIGICVYNYFKFRMDVAVWAAACIAGFAINLPGWNGSIAWIISAIPGAEVIANNVGAFVILMSIGQMLSHTRPEKFTSWLSGAIIWLSRLFALLAVIALFPLSAHLLPLQIILIPVALIIIGIFWFEQKISSPSERIAWAAFALVLVYFLTTTLILTGLISAFTFTHILLSALAVGASICITWASWLSAKMRGSGVAVEGLVVPNVHWPLLRKINHEIRGPINGVLGMAELLQDTTLSAHQQEYINTIQTAGFSLLREADQIQNLIRIGLNRLPESEDEFDLFDLVEDTLKPFSRVAHSKNLELVLDIAPEIPARYRGNAHIIGQILANLIDNALKFTENGEVLVQVKPWQNQRLRFSVTDTGPGIANETKAQLYAFPDAKNDLQQLPKDVHLGLPITRYLVGLIGGQLSLSSELRMGTTFWADLPLTVAKLTTHTHQSNDNLKLEDLRLMVVDDNLTCRKVIEHLAMSWGADVLSMSNGQSALANLHNQFHKSEPVDVLILDQNMPSMSGFELAERIRHDEDLNKDIIIIMLTGADDVELAASESEIDIEFVLSKPVSSRALNEALKNALPNIAKNREHHNAKKPLFF